MQTGALARGRQQLATSSQHNNPASQRTLNTFTEGEDIHVCICAKTTSSLWLANSCYQWMHLCHMNDSLRCKVSQASSVTAANQLLQLTQLAGKQTSAGLTAT